MIVVKEIGNRITADPAMLGGKPAIRGRRLAVEFIIRQIAGGMSIAEVSDQYDLPPEDIKAALEYAAHLVSLRRVRE